VLVERLVSNLVANAVRYNAPGGYIWIRTGSAPGNR
jgi:signal transduction histidine kinase